MGIWLIQILICNICITNFYKNNHYLLLFIKAGFIGYQPIFYTKCMFFGWLSVSYCLAGFWGLPVNYSFKLYTLWLVVCLIIHCQAAPCNWSLDVHSHGLSSVTYEFDHLYNSTGISCFCDSTASTILLNLESGLDRRADGLSNSAI